jgi:MFS superfamily sulfate permease-like transporter
MAATSVPQLIAYAETVGYAGYRGLSTAGPPLLAWGFVTGSPFMNCGVTSITALMAKTDLDGEAYVNEYGEEEYVKLVASYSLCIGLASVLLALFGFGSLAQKVPKPVLKGFKWGCSVGVLISAVPNGILAGGSKELKRLVANSEPVAGLVTFLKSNIPAATGAVSVTNFFFGVTHPHLWSIMPVVLFVICTAFVVRGPSLLPKAFPPGSEVIFATAGATLYSIYYDYEGGIVGEIPKVDPDAGISFYNGAIKLPIQIVDVKELVNDVPIANRFGGSYLMLMVSASLFAAVNFLSIMGIASGFEAEDGIAWSAPRELISQGVSCGVAAAVGSAPVSGSMSRSLVARMTGATSQLACIITALFWIYLLPYMSIMSPTPKAALSAVIVSAVLKSVLVPKDLIRLAGLDFVAGWGTGVITALTSPTIGFGVGLVLYGILSLATTTEKKNKLA